MNKHRPRTHSYFLFRFAFAAMAFAGTLFVMPIILLAQPPSSNNNDPFAQARERLIRTVLIPGGIKNPDVLKSIANTPRHMLVPPEFVNRAYLDIAIPIGESQTISSPFIVALMTEALKPEKTDKVLEIGTGSGYQAAVLSPLVKDVFTIEIVEELSEKTQENYQEMGGYENVHFKIGDGFLGWPEYAPFDKIIVTCSPERVPDPLVKQLKEDGLMIIPVGERFQQMLYLMRKKNGKLEKEALQPTLFVPMTGSAEDIRKVKPDPANPVLRNTSFEEPVVNKFYIPGWYYQFGCIQVEATDAPDGKSVVEFSSTDPTHPSMLLQGIPLDGTKVRKIRMGASIRMENIKLGKVDGKENKEQSPAIAIQYFDENRSPIGYNYVGGNKGTRKWKLDQEVFHVPPDTREAIVSIGLFGAQGKAWFDNIIFEPVR